VAYSQGEYLSQGQSGIGASIDYATNDLINAYGGTLGFSYKGIIDLNLAFTTIDHGDGNTISRSISPGITVYLMKQNSENKRPTIGLFYSYSNNSTRHWVFKPGPDDSFAFGVMVARQAIPSKKIILQPTIGISYIKAKTGSISSNLSIPFGLRISTNIIIAIIPSVAFQFPKSTYGGNFVMVASLF
jgi:hypothetical protein